jgi:hypothetical protein
MTEVPQRLDEAAESVQASLSHSRRLIKEEKGMYRLVRPNHGSQVMLVIHRSYSCRDVEVVAISALEISGLART